MIKKPNVWLLRGRAHNIDRVEEFLNEGIVAIGWPLIGNLKNKGKEYIED